jgi:hypothetical protein
MEIAHGFCAVGWLLVHGLLALTSFNLLSGDGRRANYYDRLAALPQLEVQAVLLCLGLGLAFVMLRRAPARWHGLLPALGLALLGIVSGGQAAWLLTLGVIGAGIGFYLSVDRLVWGGWIAGLALLVLIALLAQKVLPLAAWLFAWPALLLSAAAAFVAWSDPEFRRPWTPFLPALAVILIGGPVLALGHAAFIGLGAGLPSVMLFPLLILAIGCWPLARTSRWHSTTLFVIAMLTVAAGAIALHVRVDPMAETVPAYSLDT